MNKTVFFYGSILAILAFVLTWIDYRFWMRDIGIEVYGILIAVIFAGLGIWIERQRSTPTPKAELNATTKNVLQLTPREIDMLEFLNQGKSNKEIARDLKLSPNTVKTHLANLYQKLGVKNRTQAATYFANISKNAVIQSDEIGQLTHMGE